MPRMTGFCKRPTCTIFLHIKDMMPLEKAEERCKKEEREEAAGVKQLKAVKLLLALLQRLSGLLQQEIHLRLYK